MQFAATYSIVAYDHETKQLGAAVQSHWFNVADVIWVRPLVGAVATQSLASFDYGPRIMALLRNNATAEDAMNTLLRKDEDRDLRQIGVVTPQTRASFTGERCIRHAGHRTGDQFAIQANLMQKPTVWDAMAEAYESSDGDLAERLMTALEAGEAEGGDLRGSQSCALVVMTGAPTGRDWEDKVVDIRVDDHEQPLIEMRRSLNVAKAYDWMIKGEKLLSSRKPEEAIEAHQAALKLAPKRTEVMFWTAVTYVSVGRLDDALPLFKKCFDRHDNWRELVRRLPESGLLPDDPELLRKITELS